MNFPLEFLIIVGNIRSVILSEMDNTILDIKPRRLWMLLLCGFLFFLYNSNLHRLSTNDTLPARLLPFSLLVDGSLYLDNWVEPYRQRSAHFGLPYFVSESRGHWMSSYPILTPLVITPLYVVPAWWLSQQPDTVPASTISLIADTMEKLSASLIAALSAGVLYLALGKVVSTPGSLLIALVYGMASSTWSVSSQALWTHGLTQLAFAFLLWALLRDPASWGYGFWVGLALAFAAANRPPNVLMAVALLIYFALRQRHQLLAFCAPLVIVGLGVLAYNLHFFGSVLGASPDAVRTSGALDIFLQGSAGKGIAGLLLSPNKGLLVFMPWTIFALWGAVRLWRQRNFAWGPYVIVGAVALFLVYAQYDRWWGGWCFGPRYLTDLLPFLAFSLIAVLPRIQAAPLLQIAFALAIVVAVWVQVVGTYYYPGGQWDSQPLDVDTHPERTWDWPDTTISRNWQEGPAPPDLYERWSVFLTGVALAEPAIERPPDSIPKSHLLAPPAPLVAEQESKVGHRRTVLVGDLNMNPFEKVWLGQLDYMR